MEMLNSKQILDNRDEIIALLRSTKRQGIENVLSYLDKSGFYEAPSSIDGHHNWRGGLAEHCLGVCRISLANGHGLPLDSLIVTAVLHDICKASKLYYDEKGDIQHRNTYIRGHGYRSVWLLDHLCLELTCDERLVIRWHMGGPNVKKDELQELCRAKSTELWRVIHQADILDASGG